MEFPVAREPNVPLLDIVQSANVQVVGVEIHHQSVSNVSVEIKTCRMFIASS